MKLIQTPLAGLLIIEPTVFEDERGYFFESFNEKMFSEAGIVANFVQDNQSLSNKGVLRGLHFQNPPFAQAKLVRVIKGAVLDVAVDIRKKSATYGHHFSLLLSESNKKMLFIPDGFAHGFQTLEDDTVFFYKCSNYYNKTAEDCISWNDPTPKITWKKIDPIISDKDKLGKPFGAFNSLF
jgi:dTDP-4-dehydrorhamnose 3,5-epimerase